MTAPLGYLASFAYDRSQSATRRIDAYLADGVPVVLDSGAFSVMNSGATVDLSEHAGWVREWTVRNTHGTQLLAIALDVIGDQQQTRRNYERQLHLGAKVIPTIHYPTDPRTIDWSLDSPTGWVCLGGMVRYLSTSHLTNIIAWSAAIMQRTTASSIRVHALGAVVPEVHWRLPIDSCDSTYWLSGSRHGQHAVFDPNTRHWRKIKTRTRDAYKYATLLRDVYDVEPQEVAEDTRGSSGREFAERLAIRSHAMFAETFRRRHGSDLVVHLAGGAPSITGDGVSPTARKAG